MTIEQRLARLETRNRVLTACLLLAGGLFLMGQGKPAPEVLRASAFELVDGAGKTRGALKLVDGQPSLALLDEAGKPRAVLFSGRWDAGLRLLDETGRDRAVVKADEVGGELQFLDERPRVILHADAFELNDEGGRQRIRMAIFRDQASFALSHGGPTPLMGGTALGLDVRNGYPHLYMRGRRGTITTLPPQPPAAAPGGAKPATEPLFRIRKGGKEGFIDRKGNVVIEPRFPSALDFQDGMAWVMPDPPEDAPRGYPLSGYIDGTGRVVVPHQGVGGFSEGLLVSGPGDLAGYVDRTGEWAIEPRFHSAAHFSGGLAAAMMDGKWGFIDKAGKWVIEPRFSTVRHFSAGLASAAEGGKQGYVDRSGAWVIEPRFDLSLDFSEGLAAAQVGEKYGYVDKTGKWVIEPRYELVRDFSEGLAQFYADGKWGYLDKTGKVVIPARFDQSRWFSDGRAAVATGGRFGYIDRTGKMVIAARFSLAVPFRNGLARVYEGEARSRMGYIDTEGNYVWGPVEQD